MRNCNPVVLIYLVRVWRSHSCLRRKCKLCYTICMHLCWIRSLIVENLFFILITLRLFLLLRWWSHFKTRWSRSFIMKATVMTVLTSSLIWRRLINLLVSVGLLAFKKSLSGLCFHSLFVRLTPFRLITLFVLNCDFTHFVKWGVHFEACLQVF